MRKRFGKHGFNDLIKGGGGENADGRLKMFERSGLELFLANSSVLEIKDRLVWNIWFVGSGALNFDCFNSEFF